jgi:lysophospholipase L1-like esterase
MLSLPRPFGLAALAAFAFAGAACASVSDMRPAYDIGPASTKTADDFACSAGDGSVADDDPAIYRRSDALPSRSALGRLAAMQPATVPALDLGRQPGFALAPDGRQRRIAVWGDSHMAAGPMPRHVLGAVRRRMGGIGMGFLPPTMGRSNIVLPQIAGFTVGEQSFDTDLAWKASAPVLTGPGLATRVVTAGRDAEMTLDLRTREDNRAVISGLELVYRPSLDGTVIALSVNDGPARRVTLGGQGRDTRFLPISGVGAIATLRLAVLEGTLLLEGFRVAYETPPPALVDIFALPGSTANGWAKADPGHLARALKGETYDAVILEYGTNDAADPGFDPADFRATMHAALTNMRRVFPRASCVIVGPPDRGALKGGGDPLTWSRRHRAIAEIQAALAPEFGCVFWDWQGFMGGEGGAYGWAWSTPMLMGRDLVHLTPEGYRRSGRALAESLGWLGQDFCS